MPKVNFAVYSTVLGSPTSRPVIRWGECAEDAVSQQAGTNEAAAVAPSNIIFAVAGERGIDPKAIVENLYNPSNGGFGISLVLSSNDPQEARRQRNILLAETDFTQLPDVPITTAKRAEFATYRQALRDLPTQSGWPNMAWPARPTYVKA